MSKANQYTPEEKLDILQIWTNGQSAASIAKQYSINESTLRKWRHYKV